MNGPRSIGPFHRPAPAQSAEPAAPARPVMALPTEGSRLDRMMGRSPLPSPRIEPAARTGRPLHAIAPVQLGRSSGRVQAAPRPAPAPAAPPPPPPSSDHPVLEALEGVFLGDLVPEENRTGYTTAAQIATGFIPVAGQLADARDTVAAVKRAWNGEEGSATGLGLAVVGWVPGVGDWLKAGGRVAKTAVRHGDEAADAAAAARRSASAAPPPSALPTAVRPAPAPAPLQRAEPPAPPVRRTPEARRTRPLGSPPKPRPDPRAELHAQLRREMQYYARGEKTVAKRMAEDPALARANKEDLLAIYGYTSDGSDAINTALRSGDPAELARLQPYIDGMKRGLEHLPAHQGTVFRGVRVDDPSELIAAYQEAQRTGQPIVEKAFTSSTRSAEPPPTLDGVRIVMELESKTGKNIESVSFFRHEESEVLFSPGTRFHIDEVREGAGGVWYVRGREAP